MRVFAFALVFVSGSLCIFQTSPKKEPPVTERLCGKLVHTEEIPARNAPNTFETRNKNLARVTLRLYRPEGDQLCCDGLALVSETKSGHRREFHLDRKGIPPALYWIVARLPPQEYRMLVRYSPKKDSSELCNDRLFTTDDAGNFGISKTITVD